MDHTRTTQRKAVGRHLLGLGVLVLTVICGYAVSGFAVAREPRQAQSAPAPVVDIDTFIATASSRYGVSEELIAAIIEAESEFNPRAVSRHGAQGLMQLMPETAALLGVDDPFDPRANIDGGVRHLRALMDRFDNNLPLVLAAYNAGEVAVAKHRGVPPYRETRGYVNRILRRLNRNISHDLART